MIGKKTPQVDAFWQEARKALGLPESDYHVSTFAEPKFTQKVDYISQHAADGHKRGTCHLDLDFEVNKVRRRKVGDYWVVVNLANAPLCLVRVWRIDFIPFDRIGEDFAKVENEGDGTFKYWYDGHLGYFQRQCAAWGHEWRMDRTCVCEYFEKVYPR